MQYIIQRRSCRLSTKPNRHFYDHLIIINNVNILTIYESSRGKWSHLGQLKKKFLPSIAWINKLTLLYPISKFSYRRIFKKTKSLLSNLAVIYYVLRNNFHYNRLVFVFYCVHDNIDPFCFLRFQKNFDTFQVPLLEALFYFLIRFSWYFYIYEKMLI